MGVRRLRACRVCQRNPDELPADFTEYQLSRERALRGPPVGSRVVVRAVLAHGCFVILVLFVRCLGLAAVNGGMGVRVEDQPDPHEEGYERDDGDDNGS